MVKSKYIWLSRERKTGFYYLQFFKSATVNNPFYSYCYRRPYDLTDPCGHMDLLVHYAVNEMRGSCFQGETGFSWICCPLCSQWYYDECYDN